MGAWDYGIFDDDSAYDFFQEIESDPISFFKNSSNQLKNCDYVEYEDGHAILVTAAYVDNLLNQTTFRNDNENLETFENVNIFYKLYEGLNVDNILLPIISGLQKTISTQSELDELWQENEELYPRWKSQIEDVISRLSKHIK